MSCCCHPPTALRRVVRIQGGFLVASIEMRPCFLSSSIRGWSCTPEHGACTKTLENQNRNRRPHEEGPTRKAARSSSKSSQARLQLCRDSAPSADTVLAEPSQGSVEANQTPQKERSNPTGEEAFTKDAVSSSKRTSAFAEERKPPPST